ncbi:MAG: hypothetical protein AAF437_03245 [Pseudomonadota bacterium]
MTRSLLERLKNTIRDNLADFLEVEQQSETPSLENMSSSEIVSRLKLRLGAVEAERYRLAQILAEAATPKVLEARASAALDAGDERLAREILRLKVDHASTRSEAAEKREDLDFEAEDLQALIALIEDDSEIAESLEDRLKKYDAALSAPTKTDKKG